MDRSQRPDFTEKNICIVQNNGKDTGKVHVGGNMIVWGRFWCW